MVGAKRKEEKGSEITHPGMSPFLLEPAEPAAGTVKAGEDGQGHGPDHPDLGKAEAISLIGAIERGKQQINEVQQVEVSNVEKQGNPPDQGQQSPGLRALQEGQGEQADAQGEQDELERWRVLGEVEERHQARLCRTPGLPGMVAINIEQAENDEAAQGRQAHREQSALPACLQNATRVQRPEQVAEQDDADPRQDGVGGTGRDATPQFDDAALVQDGPGDESRLAAGEMHAVERVVAKDEQSHQQNLNGARQPEQSRKRQHGQADCPDHLQVDHLRREAEGPGEIHHGQFQHDQQQPALGQIGSRLTRAAPAAVQPGAQAGQQDENRCADVAGQAREKQLQRGRCNDHRVADLEMEIEELAHMVDQHQQHDGAAQPVDAAKAGCVGGWRHMV